jgi:exonuclease VII small subunit
MGNNKQPKTKDFLQEKFDTLESILKELSDNNQHSIDYLIDRYEEGLKIAMEARQYLTQLEGRLININEQ